MTSEPSLGLRLVGFPQHPDEHARKNPVLLAVDQQSANSPLSASRSWRPRMSRTLRSPSAHEGHGARDQHFVADRFGVGYTGRCPRQFPAHGDIDWGVWTARSSGADDRVVYRVGHPFSEWVGEARLVRDASRSWHVASLEEYPPLGT